MYMKLKESNTMYKTEEMCEVRSIPKGTFPSMEGERKKNGEIFFSGHTIEGLSLTATILKKIVEKKQKK